jgi:hypothetical protein
MNKIPTKNKKILKKIGNDHYDLNSFYKGDCCLVVAAAYGDEGLTPCHIGSSNCCITSSGDSICGYYMGHFDVDMDGHKRFIVMCSSLVLCEEHIDYYDDGDGMNGKINREDFEL